MKPSPTVDQRHQHSTAATEFSHEVSAVSILQPVFIGLILAAAVIFHLVSDALHVRNMVSIATITVLYNIYVYLRSKANVYTFLQPSVIGINYIYLSMALGALAFVSDNIIIPRMRSDAAEWLTSAIPILFLAGVVCLVVAFGDHRPKHTAWTLPSPSPTRVTMLLLLTVGTAFVGSEVDLIFVGPLASVTYLIYALHVAGYKVGKARLLLYALPLIPLSIFLAHDKRDVIFPLIGVILLEALVRERFTVRRMLLWILFCTPTVLALILVMTFLREPEQPAITGVRDFIAAMSVYVRRTDFLAKLFLSLEWTYTYVHTFNAINYALTDRIPALLGSTYVKVLFIFVPREWIDWKPNSIIHIYTSYYDQKYWSIGGSWVSSMVGEAILNFRLFGAVILALILTVFDRLFVRYVLIQRRRNYLFVGSALYGMVAFLLYARGSGLDLALILFLVAASCCGCLALVMKYGRHGEVVSVGSIGSERRP